MLHSSDLTLSQMNSVFLVLCWYFLIILKYSSPSSRVIGNEHLNRGQSTTDILSDRD